MEKLIEILKILEMLLVNSTVKRVASIYVVCVFF